MRGNMKIPNFMFSVIVFAAIPSALQAQSNGLKEIGEINRIIAKANRGVKGWTCRDPEDGKRLHRVDPTNIARMGKIPSSEAGLHDSKTPLEKLPICTTPH